jgi:GMP synthase-like glutamine amidotransferase
VQFHPESIASDYGHKILGNFLEIAGLSINHDFLQENKKAS